MLKCVSPALQIIATDFATDRSSNTNNYTITDISPQQMTLPIRSAFLVVSAREIRRDRLAEA